MPKSYIYTTYNAVYLRVNKSYILVSISYHLHKVNWCSELECLHTIFRGEIYQYTKWRMLTQIANDRMFYKEILSRDYSIKHVCELVCRQFS